MADVRYIDGREHLIDRLEELLRDVKENKVAGVAFVVVYTEGGIEPRWASLNLGNHAATTMRGAVAYLENIMDRDAKWPESFPEAGT